MTIFNKVHKNPWRGTIAKPWWYELCVFVISASSRLAHNTYILINGFTNNITATYAKYALNACNSVRSPDRLSLEYIRHNFTERQELLRSEYCCWITWLRTSTAVVHRWLVTSLKRQRKTTNKQNRLWHGLCHDYRLYEAYSPNAVLSYRTLYNVL